MVRMAAVAALSAAGGSVRLRYATRAKTCNTAKTRTDAKCSDVTTALKPTTGTEAASRVPKMIYEAKRGVNMGPRSCPRFCSGWLPILFGLSGRVPLSGFSRLIGAALVLNKR